MNLAICDDDFYIVGEIETIVHECIKDLEQKIDCDVFTSAEEVMSFLDENKEYQIYILDVEMPGMSGFELAERIRDRDKGALIIFMTSHRELMQNAFDVFAYHYLVKPIDRDKLKSVLLKAIEYYSSKKAFFDFKISKSIFTINNGMIECFESKLRKIIIHAQGIQYEYYGSIKEVMLKSNPLVFAQVHNSYVVNMEYIAAMDGKTVSLRSGREIPITKKYYQSFNQKYKNFILMRMG